MRLKYRALGVVLASITIVTSFSFIGLPTAAQAAEPAPELIGHWTFDDATFATGAGDAVSGNPARLSGNCTTPTPSTNMPPSVTAGDARSLSLDGQSCLVITNPFRAVAGVHGDILDFSICTWINTTSQGTGVNHWNSAPILDGEVGGVSNDFGFGLSQTGKLTFGTGRANGTNDERIDGATTVNDGRWHHVCVTRDSTKTTGNVILYVDGARDIGTSSNGRGGSNQDSPSRSVNAHIGWGQDDNHNRFVGFMDDLRTYDGVLDDAEIGNLYSGSDDLQASADGEAPAPGDGVPASIENVAPNGGDANADGTADRLQRNVASLPNTVDGQYTTLVMSAAVGGCALSSVTNGNAPADPGYAYMAGLTTYTADCDADSTARVTLYQYGETCNRLAVRSYDPTSGTYSTIDAATIRQTTIDGTVVAVGTFDVPAGGVTTGTFGIAQSTSACPVSPLNALPIIMVDGVPAPDSLSDHTNTATAWSLALTATEPGPSPFTWSISGQPAFGVASTSVTTGTDVTLEYVPQSGFVGTDSFTVRLANGSGGFDYLSVEIAIGPQVANSTTPTISVAGSLFVLSTLSMASTGSWDFPASSAGRGTRYQWFKIRGSSRTPINGATGATLELTPDLIGADVFVQETAWANGYVPASVDSAPVGPVLALDFSDIGEATVAGTPQTGETLTADSDVAGWAPVPDGFTYQWFADGAAIAGATAASFVVTPDLVGGDVFARVTAVRSGYSPVSVDSGVVGPVRSGTFSRVGAPTVSGNATVDETLTADPDAGGWSPAPDGFAYQWSADGIAVDGATASTFVLTPDLVGADISVQVRAVRTGFTPASADSGAFGPVLAGVFSRVGTPTVSGLPRTGEILTAGADITGWSPVPDGFAYQWSADGIAVDGATASTLVLRPDLVGADISVRVTALRAGFTAASADSAAAGSVLAGVFSRVGTPTVSGSPRVGETLTAGANLAGWSPAPDAFTYQWFVDGAAVDGATDAELVLTAELVGSDASVQVTAVRAGYTAASAGSAAVGPVLVGVFSRVGTPTVNGTAAVGETLTADTDSDGWAPVPVDFSYQWFADGSAVDGATSRSFRVASDQLGSILTVMVTASRVGWADASATSEPSGRVTATVSDVTQPVPPNQQASNDSEQLSSLVNTGAAVSAVLPFGATLVVLIGVLLLIEVRRRRRGVGQE